MIALDLVQQLLLFQPILLCILEALHLIKFPRNNELFRPNLSDVESIQPFLKEVMVECWKENANQRPNFFEIKKKLKPLNNGL